MIPAYNEAELFASESERMTAPVPAVIGTTHMTDALRITIVNAFMDKIEETHMLGEDYVKTIGVTFDRKSHRVAVTVPEIIAKDMEKPWKINFTAPEIDTEITLTFEDKQTAFKKHATEKTWMGGHIITDTTQNTNQCMDDIRAAFARYDFQVVKINKPEGTKFYLEFEHANSMPRDFPPQYHRIKHITFSDTTTGNFRPFSNFFVNVDCCRICLRMLYHGRKDCKCLESEPGSSSNAGKRRNKFEQARAAAKKAKK